MKRTFHFTVLLLIGVIMLSSCGKTGRRAIKEKPKIVVGLVVDQMRWDYIYRYWDRYGDEGFKRLVREGFSCENTFVRHVPTATAPGHSSIYTGSVPAINGIVGNSWYDRAWGRKISNVEDTTVQLVGVKSKDGRSPRNLLTTTIGDELRIATNYRSKVVGVAIKDRAAILPAGHTANGAFWYKQGKFISSTYYMDALPDWVNQFNNINWSDSLMPNGWNTLYPIDTYAQSDKDDKNYEKTFSGEAKPVFPHRKASLTSTPFGNTLTLDFARAAIEGYKLGKGNFTDMLTISLSSPDRIGHRFGPNSIEEEDDYLRLDKDLAKFFNYLDNRFGKDGYLFFLTADHGVDQSPGYLKEHDIPSGVLNVKKIVKDVNTALQKRYGLTNIILSVTDGQVYLNYNVLAKNKLDRLEVAKFVAAQLKKEPGIKNAFAAEMLGTATLTEPIKSMYINGYNPKRSGDVLVIWSAGWKPGSPKGAEHGNWYPYDAHIPLVWMGWGVPHGETHRNIGMTDIAPTIAALLHIQMPSGSIGKVITEFVDRQD